MAALHASDTGLNPAQNSASRTTYNSLLADMPPSIRKAMDRTLEPALQYFLRLCFTLMYVTSHKNLSLPASVSLRLFKGIYTSKYLIHFFFILC